LDYPLLSLPVPARIAQAVHRALQDDPGLASFHGGNIAIVEMAAVLSSESVNAPFIGVCLLADRDRLAGSSYAGELETVVQILLLTHPPMDLQDTTDLLRVRVVAAVRRVLRRDRGVLRDEDGQELNTATTEVRSIAFDRAQLPSRLVLTAMEAVFRSPVDLESQELFE
jgi:hypothetical protein